MVAVKLAKPRKKGRPTPRGSVGKEALVAAAREALKHRAPGEITLHEIAVIAGVDPALIRYYGLLEQSLEELDEIVREGSARGELKDLDPRFLQLGIAAMCEFFHSARPICETIFGPEANDTKFVDAYRQFIIALVSESNGAKNRRSRRASAGRARVQRPAGHAS